MRGLIWLLNKYNYVLVFILLEAIALTLLSNHNSYQRSIISNAHREISGKIFEKTQGSREYLLLRKNNEALVRENALLRNKLTILDAKLSDTAANSISEASYFYTPAHIVNSTHLKQFNYLTIDKGRKQGIHRDMGVIGDEGIVGIVLESSANYSTIIPIINRDFRLSVKVKKNNFSGILQWEGTDYRIADMNEIPYHADISVGDSIVSSGFSSVFPEGLFLGRIKSFTMQEGNFYRIQVELGTNFQRLFHVNVINNFKQKEQVELESNLNK
jgi:rod shape-determining protein MreC